MTESPTSCHYQWLNTYHKKRPTLVLLHGFTGSQATFKQAPEYLKNYNLLGIDLLGHGQSPSPTNHHQYRMAETIMELTKLIQTLALTNITVLGYSMGGRIALAWAISEPQLITTLILESASPGLQPASEREQRQQADHRLAQKIMTEGLLDFVNYWEALPLFASQSRLSKAQQQQIRTERLSQNPVGLVGSLLGVGTGQQSSYWLKLSDLPSQTLCLTGASDKKFIGIAEEMVSQNTAIKHQIILSAGHCVHLEQPADFYHAVATFLGETSYED